MDSVSENTLLCNCKKVTRADVEKALRQSKRMTDVTQVFDDVQDVTGCSTGCGQCHDKIMGVISEMMYDIV